MTTEKATPQPASSTIEIDQEVINTLKCIFVPKSAGHRAVEKRECAMQLLMDLLQEEKKEDSNTPKARLAVKKAADAVIEERCRETGIVRECNGKVVPPPAVTIQKRQLKVLGDVLNDQAAHSKAYLTKSDAVSGKLDQSLRELKAAQRNLELTLQGLKNSCGKKYK